MDVIGLSSEDKNEVCMDLFKGFVLTMFGFFSIVFVFVLIGWI